MKEYTNENPVFSDTLPITETTDVGHPDTINPGPIQAFENTLSNRKAIQQLEDQTGETYMPKSGGEFTGGIRFASEMDIRTNSHRITAGRSHNEGLNLLWIVSEAPWAGLRVASYTTVTGKYGVVSDTYDNISDLGSATLRWKQLYAANSTISTSDRNEKYDISYIGNDSEHDTKTTDKLLTKLIMGMKPAVFKRINGESGRSHHGMIAQDIEELILSLGIDHAGFIKSPVKKQVEVYEVDGKEVMRRDLEGVLDEEMQEEIQKEYGEDVKKRIVEETVEGEFRYGLRYEEFIGDIIRFCQILKNENKQLKKEIQAIKSNILLKTKER